MCCHTEIEVADQTCCLTQSQYTSSSVFPSYISGVHHSSSAFPSYISGVHHSSSSAFPSYISEVHHSSSSAFPSYISGVHHSSSSAFPSYIFGVHHSSSSSSAFPSYISGVHHSSSSAFPSYISGVHHSSSSAFPSYIFGVHHSSSSSSAFPSYISGVHHFWVRSLHMWPFCNPTIEVVTFRLRGYTRVTILKSLVSSSSPAIPVRPLGFIILGEIFAYLTVFQSNRKGSHILSSRMVHAGCVVLADIHQSRTWMSGLYESMQWNARVRPQRFQVRRWQYISSSPPWVHSPYNIPTTVIPYRLVHHGYIALTTTLLLWLPLGS